LTGDAPSDIKPHGMNGMRRSFIISALSIFLFFLIVALPHGIGFAQNEFTHGDHEGSLSHDGRTRTYIVHIPPFYDGTKPLPLVIVLHGGGGNARHVPKLTKMSAKADKEGFIVVYPNGSGRLQKRLLTWNAGNCCAYALDEKVDDVGFVRALIDKLEGRLAIDPKRVYATGISNGGMMTYALACELSDKLAAIGVVAGALNYKPCRPKEPVSVVIFHGTADEHVLYGGGRPKRMADWHDRIDKPVSYAVSFWAKHDKCSSKEKAKIKENIIREAHGGCADGTEVVLYTIEGGGHVWPGGLRLRRSDDPSHAISATDIIWNFFKHHPKR